MVASDTRQRLIDTALDLIWKSSYGSVSVDDICKAADVKKGSFYHFFPSKVDLAVAAMDQAYHSKQKSYDEIFSPSQPALKRFERWAQFMYDIQKDMADKSGHVCGCPQACLGSEVGVQEERVRAKFDELHNLALRYYENAIRDLVAEGVLSEATNTKVKAYEVYTYITGQLTMARIENSLENLASNLKDGIFSVLGVPSV